MAESFRDLIVWQQGMVLVEDIYKASSGFPRSEDFALTSQMRRAAVSIPSNVSEGSGRGDRIFLYHLLVARGSLRELSTQVEAARRVGYLELGSESILQNKCDSVGKLLSLLIKSIRNGSQFKTEPDRVDPFSNENDIGDA